MTSGDSLLTIQQAADKLHVHYQTIRNWMKRGEIEYWKRGKTVRIPQEALYGKAGQSRGHDL